MSNRVNLRAIAAIAIVGAAALAILAPTSDEDPAQEIRQIGYFKDDDRNRVLAYHVDERPPEEVVFELFDRVPWTEGHLTRALIYVGADNPAPADGLTLARDLKSALVLTANPPFDDWAWVLHINPKGEKTVSSQ